jgi:crotonobetainyl-CoA:carnitine CoA-transferase CaiB-like acyl-CoA transferase
VAVRTEDEWRRFCEVIGKPELLTDPRFELYPERYRNRHELDNIIMEWSIGFEPQEAFQLLIDAGIPAGPVQGGPEVLYDPHLAARGYFQDVPQTEAGTHPIKTRPMKFSETPGTIRLPAPTLGEHNEYILSGLLGVTREELEALEREGVIGTRPNSLERPVRGG